MKLIVSSFLLLLILPSNVLGAVVVNEIAWMGTVTSANDEWIELYNNGSEAVDLTGWRITAADGQPDITLDANICPNTTIPAGGYFLLERTDDETVP
ncbi:MAG: lamin tail domain-containing protein, partial [Patescibacteria group bacterium]